MKLDQSGRSFAKLYANSAIATEAIRRCRMARHAGVTTPNIVSEINGDTLNFERIDGECGVELLQTADMRQLLSPLVKMHKIDQQKLSRFDPFLRIDPRVEAFTLPPEFVLEIQKRKNIAFPASVVVHGDFHLGQLIRDAAGNCWVVDLDDLAIGSPEVDLGNMIAFLATHPSTMGDSMLESIRHWERQITVAWCDLEQVYQKVQLQYFMQVALVRRTLKRYEAGDYSLLGDCMSILLASG